MKLGIMSFWAIGSIRTRGSSSRDRDRRIGGRAIGAAAQEEARRTATATALTSAARDPRTADPKMRLLILFWDLWLCLFPVCLVGQLPQLMGLFCRSYYLPTSFLPTEREKLHRLLPKSEWPCYPNQVVLLRLVLNWDFPFFRKREWKEMLRKNEKRPVSLNSSSPSPSI